MSFMPSPPCAASYPRYCGPAGAGLQLSGHQLYPFPNGSYEFPPFDGFQLSISDMPFDGTQLLLPGMRLDRFGSAHGMFLAPADTPFSQRSLPPSSLGPPAAYHVYLVKKNSTALAGEIAGQGTQYFVNMTIQELLEAEVLVEIDE
ncbi:putative filamentous hemagglutinin adhesin protein [Mycena venus]|uniref:Putative filamentous hemagglutinin adhesin protein n=1 Tax=Mycena venus TaxID=2733690 RepID=A0A8H6YVN8_9AGAR|nr:putative filamentous hemagglutinin adhesin protein [Mycena venus]